MVIEPNDSDKDERNCVGQIRRPFEKLCFQTTRGRLRAAYLKDEQRNDDREGSVAQSFKASRLGEIGYSPLSSDPGCIVFVLVATLMKSSRTGCAAPAGAATRECFDQAALISPSWVNAVTPSSRPISSTILPLTTLSTVVPVKCILRPVAAGKLPTRKSSKAGPE